MEGEFCAGTVFQEYKKVELPGLLIVTAVAPLFPPKQFTFVGVAIANDQFGLCVPTLTVRVTAQELDPVTVTV